MKVKQLQKILDKQKDISIVKKVNNNHLEKIKTPYGVINARKDRLKDYIEILPNKIIVEIIGKTKGKRKFKIGEKYE